MTTKWYVLAYIDITGPAPIVTGVRFCGENNPTLDHSRYRVWQLAEGSTR